MNIGDYVRTEYGICKIIRELHDRFEIDNKIIFDRGIMVQDLMKDSPFDNNQIIKSAPNIIDLIEVGDYVNGCKVNDIIGTRVYLKVVGLGYDVDNEYIDIEEIKSIVTKKQYERMEYKI